MNDDSLLAVSHLKVAFDTPGWRSPQQIAVDDVSLEVNEAETVGLVGESGSGKSTIGRAVLGLVRPASGEIHLRGEDITRASASQRRTVARDLSVVFQDPYSSLNPALTIGETLLEPLLVQGRNRRDAVEVVTQMLDRVGLRADAMRRYPGEFSGGQRQRIAIARALTVKPDLVICDEPVSSLDLSIQAQVINLLAELQRDYALAMLFISHDLTIVRHLSHRIIVLLRGRVMETGLAEDVYAQPQHPYTKALLLASPVPDPDEQATRRELRRAAIAQQETVGLGLGRVGKGCPFVARCPLRMEICTDVRPELVPSPVGSDVACHLFGEGGKQPAARTVS